MERIAINALGVSASASVTRVLLRANNLKRVFVDRERKSLRVTLLNVTVKD